MTISDREIDHRLSGLVRETDPPEHIWAGIEQRLKPARRGRFGVVTGLVAVAACLMIAVLVMRTPEQIYFNPSETVISAEVSAMRSQAVGLSLAEFDPVERELVSAWEENEDAISELETALARHPDNVLLVEFLALAHLRQSELIKQATVGPTLANHYQE